MTEICVPEKLTVCFGAKAAHESQIEVLLCVAKAVRNCSVAGGVSTKHSQR
jgi:hypothetical protein